MIMVVITVVSRWHRCNLPFISKGLQKVMVSQLVEHLQRNSLLEMFQSGFRAPHSKETARVKATITSSDNGLVSQSPSLSHVVRLGAIMA